jgi:hypothetical protein
MTLHATRILCRRRQVAGGGLQVVFHLQRVGVALLGVAGEGQPLLSERVSVFTNAGGVGSEVFRYRDT